MKNSIKQEIASHIIDKINNGVITNENKGDWNHLCFNQDYFIVGYYECSEWLKKHDLDAFEAIEICNQYELDIFGEESEKYTDSEKIVNMLAYIYGEELLSEIDADSIEELDKAVKDHC